MRFYLHQTHHTIADFPAILVGLKNVSQTEGVHLFPELYLTGYPLADVCLQASFIEGYKKHLASINAWLKTLKPNDNWVALVGGLAYDLGSDGVPLKIRNVIYELRPGQPLKDLYTKRLLPNYDIFDEQKYFSPGKTPGVWQWQGKNFGLLICEDMWASSFHDLDPCLDLAGLKSSVGQLSAVINLSASPFDATKQDKRLDRAKVLSQLLHAPFFYINRVGGEDEILFDGQSFVVNDTQTVARAPAFESHTLTVDLPAETTYSEPGAMLLENTWESLFSPNFSTNKALPRQLETWDDGTCALVWKALQFGLQEYARKTGFKKFLIALSGGMDSALVLTLVRTSLQPGQEVEAIYMPSIHSATLSWDLSAQLCERLGIRLISLPIKFLHSNVKISFQSTFSDPFLGLTDENVQSRLRGLLLYTRSNQTGSMVVNTSNKSELAVGYSTQYGDSVGAISLLGDLYKTEVYRLSQWANTHLGNLIPAGIIERAPSAELRENQKDQDSLPAYPRLDAILEGILSYRCDQAELVSMGFNQDEVQRVFQLYAKSEYKRHQFCPIVKLKPKSFGFGYRVPISKDNRFYTQN